MDISDIALQGLQHADTELNHAATAIANVSNTKSNGDPDAGNLSQDTVTLTSVQNQFEANLVSLNPTDQVQKNLLDVTA